MRTSAPSIDGQVQSRIASRGPGAVVTRADFDDLGSPSAVHQALSRAVRAGRLRRLAQGVYELPRSDEDFGLAPPDLDRVLAAVCGRDVVRLVPSGAHAANVLGVSTQVPMRLTFLTDGPGRRLRIGRHEVVLRRASPRQLAPAGRMSATVIQALRWIGREHIDAKTLRTIRARLNARERRELLADRRYAPAWVAVHMATIGSESGEDL